MILFKICILLFITYYKDGEIRTKIQVGYGGDRKLYKILLGKPEENIGLEAIGSLK